MGCATCGRGFHKECRRCRKGKCHDTNKLEVTPIVESKSDESTLLEPQARKSARGNLKDPKSTGRKRAARLYPIDSDAPCEWRGLRNCGGGRRPIIGCLDGTQKHRHHGPVKETTRNELGNVHRICTDCHVHWHELNDLIYDEADYNLMPHQPVPATDEEIVKNKLEWLTGEMGRRYELASTKNREKYLAAQTGLHAHDSDEAELGGNDSLLESLDGESESGDVVSE